MAGLLARLITSGRLVADARATEHVGHIFDKLGAANRTEAVARARGLGLLP